jgi:hypothetical protein
VNQFSSNLNKDLDTLKQVFKNFNGSEEGKESQEKQIELLTDEEVIRNSKILKELKYIDNIKEYCPCLKPFGSLVSICQENFTLSSCNYYMQDKNKFFVINENEFLKDELSKLLTENIKLKEEIHFLRNQSYSNKTKHDYSPNTSKSKDLETLENKISQVTDEFNLIFDKMNNYQKRLVDDSRKLKEILNMILKSHHEKKTDQLSFIISQLNYNSDLSRNDDYMNYISETKNQINSQLNILKDKCTINFATESSNKASIYSTYSSKKKFDTFKFQELKLNKGVSSESINKKPALVDSKCKLVRQYSYDRTYSEMVELY